MKATLALIHSPLVGPLTWSAMLAELQRRGLPAVAPELRDSGSGSGSGPYWQQHARSAAAAIEDSAPGQPLILVGHSGAGPLLPAIRRACACPVAAYVFVDAGLPHDGLSRLAEMEESAPELAALLSEHLAAGGRFPEWSDDDLREVIPDDCLRQGLLAELRPRALDFFTEPIPGFHGQPDAPCGYIQLSAAYQAPAAQAQSQGWAYRAIDAGHFHMLVEPAAVTAALLEIARSWSRE